MSLPTDPATIASWLVDGLITDGEACKMLEEWELVKRVDASRERMRWALIPRDPFSNVSTSPGWVVHPMRGQTSNAQLAARMAGLTSTQIQSMKIGASFPTIHGEIRRVA